MYFNSEGYKPFSCFSLPYDFAQTLKWCVCACMCCMTCNKMLEKRLLEQCCSPFMLTRTIQILKIKKHESITLLAFSAHMLSAMNV